MQRPLHDDAPMMQSVPLACAVPSIVIVVTSILVERTVDEYRVQQARAATATRHIISDCG
jgi:hypothetical protein